MGAAPGGSQRFPGYDVVAQSSRWDRVTQGVVLSRLGPPPPIRFFTPAEEAVMRPLLDRLVANDDEPRVPVVEMVDARLVDDQGPGYRYHDMPEYREAWRRSARHVDEDAQARFGQPFHRLDRHDQRALLESVRTADHWHGLPAARVWTMWMHWACAAFYSHPWAWNEIGFGGPAYPRGYGALGLGAKEPWEVHEVDAADPVPWAERVEAARRRHHPGAEDPDGGP